MESLTHTRETDHLFVMQNDRIPGEINIGRSINVLQKRNQLQASQNFNMKVIVIFYSYGYLESVVHQHLKEQRVKHIPGHTWFNSTPCDAILLISSLMPPVQTNPYMSVQIDDVELRMEESMSSVSNDTLLDRPQEELECRLCTVSDHYHFCKDSEVSTNLVSDSESEVWPADPDEQEAMWRCSAFFFENRKRMQCLQSSRNLKL